MKKFKKILLFILIFSFIFSFIPFLNTVYAATEVIKKDVISLNEIQADKEYILYRDASKTEALFDDNGKMEGWLRYAAYNDNAKYRFKIVPVEKNGQKFYSLQNVGTGYFVKKIPKDLDSKQFVVSDKNFTEEKMLFVLESEESKFILKTEDGTKYLAYGEHGNYATYSSDKSKAVKFTVAEYILPPVEKPSNLYIPKENTDYILYDTDKETTIYDDGGSNEGWLRYGSYDDKQKYSFQFVKDGDAYKMKSSSTSYFVKKTVKELSDKAYVVSDKTGNEVKMRFFLEQEGDKILLKTADERNLFIRKGQDRNYLTYTADKSEAIRLTIEESPKVTYPYPEGSISLFKNPDGNNYYRIPAIATTNSGRLVAVADYRHNHGGDLGNHKIDLFVKYSDDNGQNWSDALNITSFNDKNGFGYGDPAIVADRNSNKVMIICVFGTQGYWHSNRNFVSTRKNPIRVARFLSEDNGQTFSDVTELTEQIYNLNPKFQRLFAAAGKIFQSRHVKIGDYYRLYLSILEGQTGGNYVLYSDDFGKNWQILGNDKPSVPGGDEAKLDELPNGDLVISSRIAKGRKINIFHFDENDISFTSGQWETSATLSLGNGSATNGELLILPVKNNENGQYVYLALQSLPTLNGRRDGVGVYYKEINKQRLSVSEYLEGWIPEQFMMVQKKSSAYSTMSIQDNSEIAFLYEDRYTAQGYDIQYYPFSIEKLTANKYSLAFKGTGSKDKPYLIESKEQLEAVQTVYQKEKIFYKDIYSANVEKKKNIDLSNLPADSSLKSFKFIEENKKNISSLTFVEKKLQNSKEIQALKEKYGASLPDLATLQKYRIIVYELQGYVNSENQAESNDLGLYQILINDKSLKDSRIYQVYHENALLSELAMPYTPAAGSYYRDAEDNLFIFDNHFSSFILLIEKTSDKKDSSTEKTLKENTAAVDDLKPLSGLKFSNDFAESSSDLPLKIDVGKKKDLVPDTSAVGVKPKGEKTEFFILAFLYFLYLI